MPVDSQRSSRQTAARGKRLAALHSMRRRLILDAAWTVFARNGLGGATMREIAAAAGCTTGAIYPVFASKEEIYGALLADSLGRLHAAVEARTLTAATPSEALRRGALAFLGYYKGRPEEVSLGLYLWNGLHPQGLSRRLDRELNRQLGATVGLLEAAIRALGPTRPTHARTEAAALFAFMIGALVAQQTGRLHTLGSSLDAVAELHTSALASRLARVRSAH
jgi:AcrR family transcriptional regulator